MIHLPIDDFLSEIKQSISKLPNLVLTAEPGAGKTTRLPPALLDCTTKNVIVLEPRRMAAVAAASRISEENNFQLGKEVGYQVRFDNKTSKDSRLIFMTEALLVRKMSQDPELKDVGIIVLDEFHERSLHVDLSLGLIKELQDLGADIKIVVMSATLDAENIAAYLDNCPIIAVPGKLHPLEVIYQKNSQHLRTLPAFYDSLESTIKQALNSTAHDILVFLPGVGEIDKTFNQLESSLSKVEILKLHGSLPLDEQKKALRKGALQRIILSTNIAESSVTVDGVDTVIDSGLEKNVRYDSKTGFSKLELTRISLSSAIQRSGRAARQFPGRCYRLWNKQDELSFPKDTVSEIHRSDLSESLLFLSSQGITSYGQFRWFEKPNSISLLNAEIFLKNTYLVDEDHRITELGKKVLTFPTSLRSALIATAGVENGKAQLGCLIAALIQEKDIFPKNHILHLSEAEPESDILPRLEIVAKSLKGNYSAQAHRNTLHNISQGYQQLIKVIGNISESFDINTVNKDSLDLLLAKTFKDRLCRRRGKSDKALMMGGRGVKLGAESVVKKSEFFFALNGISTHEADSTINLASAISKDFILKYYANEIFKKTELVYNEDKHQYFIHEFRVLDDLPLDEPSVKPANAQDIADKIVDLCINNMNTLLKENNSLNAWLIRLNYYLKQTAQEIFLPEITAQALEKAAYGCKSLQEVASKDLVYFWEQELPTSMLADLQNEFPEKIKVPSGSQISIQYSEDKDPYIEVRIQEIFGWKKTPAINFGKTNLIIHLLGPNFRPVQVTSNIESFWQNAYAEVRKELRIKYPKHQWPEDPADGIAEAKGRKRP